jgi:hypothetical protein
MVGKEICSAFFYLFVDSHPFFLFIRRFAVRLANGQVWA